MGKIMVPIRRLASADASLDAIDAGLDPAPNLPALVRMAVSAPETEGADDWASSTATTGRIVVGGEAIGNISNAQDFDWLRTTLEAGVTYVMRLNGAASGQGTLLDPYLFGVYDADGNFIAHGNDDIAHDRLESLAWFTPSTSGDYYLFAKGDGTTGSYRLTLDVAPADDWSASAATPGALAAGGEASGSIEIGADRDWFRVRLEAGTSYALRLIGAPSDQDGLDNPLLHGVFTANGSYLGGGNSNGYGSRELQAWFTPTADGDYYVSAGGWGRSIGNYTLALNIATDDWSAGVDGAGQVIDGAATGVIERVDDVDWFRVDLDAGVLYEITVSGAMLTGIYDAAGVRVADAQELFAPDADGDYYLAVGGGSTGAYRLAVTDAVAVVEGGDGDDFLFPSGDARFGLVRGMQGNDSLIGGGGDTLLGGDGEDLLFVHEDVWWGELPVFMDGGEGDDRLLVQTQLAAQMKGGGGADIFSLHRGSSSGSSDVNMTTYDDDLQPLVISQIAMPVRIIDFNPLEGDRIDSGVLNGIGGQYLFGFESYDATPAPVGWSGIAYADFRAQPGQQIATDPNGFLTFWVNYDPARDLTLLYMDRDRSGHVNWVDLLVEFSGNLVSNADPRMNLAPEHFSAGTFFYAALGESGDDVISLGDRAERADGRGGNDRIDGQGGNDSLWGGDGDDELLGAAGDDDLDGGAGTNWLRGGAGNDTLRFGGSADRLDGEEGDDLIYLGGTMSGGAGADRFALGRAYREEGAIDTHYFFEGWHASVSRPASVADFNPLEGDLLRTGMTKGLASFGHLGQYEPSRFGSYLLLWRGSAEPGFRAELGQSAPALAQTGVSEQFDSADEWWADSFWVQLWELYSFYDADTDRTGLYMDSDRNGVVSGADFLLWFPGQLSIDESDFEPGSFADPRHVGTAAADTLLGSEAGDSLRGLMGDDLLQGAAAADRLYGHEGNDTLQGGEGYDSLWGGAGLDLADYSDATAGLVIDLSQDGVIDFYASIEGLIGSEFADALRGDDDGNWLEGRGGNDSLDGGLGSDTLVGGAGDDQYVVDRALDVIVEMTGAGQDWVLSHSSSYTLGAELENGRIMLGGNANLFGNALDNLLVAGAGNNTLYGGSGTDTASYTTATAAVTVDLSLSGAQDTGGSGSDTLNLIENLVGSDFADVLRGNALWNLLDGGAQADTLVGGDGSDTYIIDSALDRIVETNADVKTGGSDWVHSKLVSYSLGENLENALILRSGAANLFGNGANNLIIAGSGDNRLNGSGGVDTVSYERATAAVTVDLSITAAQATGGSGTDTLSLFENLRGSAFNDQLRGNALWNWLDGGLGADTMDGGLGSDTYVVDDLGDVVIEAAGEVGSSNADWVYSRLASYRLGDFIENGAIDITGSASLTGNAQHNILMSGQGDNQLDGGAGLDTASYLRANAAVTVSLLSNTATGGSGADILISIENLIGSSFDDLLIGDQDHNDIRGGSGSDTIRGGGGNDILRGGGNNQGDGAADRFVFDTTPHGNTNYDRIVAFEGNGIDKILLDAAVFAAIGTQLEAGEFRVGSQALDADDFIVFDRTTGNLFYDADGSGAGTKILFAKLVNWSGSLGAEDFGMLPPAGG